jgi:hypothetical protein
MIDREKLLLKLEAFKRENKSAQDIFYVEEDLKRMDEKLRELQETVDRMIAKPSDPYRTYSTTMNQHGEVIVLHKSPEEA